MDVTISEVAQSRGSSISREVRRHTQRHQAPLFKDVGNFRLAWTEQQDKMGGRRRDGERLSPAQVTAPGLSISLNHYNE